MTSSLLMLDVKHDMLYDSGKVVEGNVLHKTSSVVNRAILVQVLSFKHCTSIVKNSSYVTYLLR